MNNLFNLDKIGGGGGRKKKEKKKKKKKGGKKIVSQIKNVTTDRGNTLAGKNFPWNTMAGILEG